MPSPPTRSPANKMLTARVIQGLTPTTLIITCMRRWARLRTADPPEPEGEPVPRRSRRAVRWDEHRGSTATGRSAGSSTHSHERRAAEPDARRRAVAPVVVPRWIQIVVLPLALLGLWALARAAGSVLLILIVAGGGGADPGPDRPPAASACMPRGLAILIVYLGWVRVPRGHRRAPGQPGHHADHALRAQRARHRPPRQPPARQLPDVPEQPRDQRPHQAAGLERPGHAAEGRAQALRRHRLLLPGPAVADRDDRLRPGPHPRPVDLPAHLRPPDRRRWCGGSCRRATGRPRTTTRCSSSTPSPATSAASSCSAW